MDDQFLKDAARAPRPEFAAALHEKLAREAPAPAPRRAWSWPRLSPALGAIAAAVVLVLAFTLPSVRASAQAFLDLFRVRTFTAVTVDPARIEQLQNGKIDMKDLLGDEVKTLREPGPPQVAADPEAAGRAAGIAVLVPATMPGDMKLDTVRVMGEGQAEVTVRTAKLRALLDALAIDDVELPSTLDGAKMSVHVMPAVGMHFKGGSREAILIQARSPEVGLPPGLDLPRLGEIGLRIAGMSETEAHKFAQQIDWHSTLVVPVPANASAFSEVTVRGHKALLISTTGNGKTGEHERRWRNGKVLLWSEGDKVFALSGNIDDMNLVQMANSLH